MDEPLLWLGLAAVAAGFVDAVVGGGGLIQLPALLLAFPGAAPVQLLATNKISAVAGTTVSAATYYRRIRPDPRTFGPLMACSFAGAVGGSLVASLLPRSVFDPIVLAALVLVGTYVWFKPSLGEATRLRFSGRRHVALAMLAGVIIGFYDGARAQGTGSFFVFSLVGLLGYSFLDASAKARLANMATNLGSLVVFLPMGAVMWRVGLVMAVCNIVGGYVGARVAVAKGAAFVRVFFLAVVAAFVVRIGGGLAGFW